MKRLSFILFSLLCFASYSQNPVLKFKGSEHATIGIYIQDLKTGKMVASVNPEIVMTPASVLKTITCATALEVLGSEWKYTTRFNMVGSDPYHGKGNLIIEAGADPTTGSREFPDSYHLMDSVVSSLIDRGVDYIEGKVIVDSAILPDGGGTVAQWELEDVKESYGVGLYPLNWMDNYFEEDFIIPSPTDFFKEQLLESFAINQIEIAEPTDVVVSDSVETDTLSIYTHYSAPLIEIMRNLMFRSDNLMAEGVLRALSPCEPRDSAISRLKSHWKSKGIDLEYSRIIDGSGLARGNSLSAHQVGNILTYMAQSNISGEYISLFPKVAREGTVKTFMRNSKLAGRLALKTGSMRGVQCFAGYKLNPKNNQPTHTIVVMVNNFFCSRNQLKKSIENYLLQIFP